MVYPTIICVCIVLYIRVVFGEGCTIFSTNGSSASHFEYYRFYDFRNIQTSRSEQSTSSEASLFPADRMVNNATWTDDWSIRVLSKGAANDHSLPIEYSASNVNIGTLTSPNPTSRTGKLTRPPVNSTEASRDSTTYLALSTKRLPSSQQAGELEYKLANLSYASIRVLARVRGAPGAVAGIFTYWNDTTESDIEVLTRDPATSVQYSNQPTTVDSGATVQGSTWNVTMPSGTAWTSWNVHRLDWAPGQSAWYANGVRMAGTGVNVPRNPSMLILNMWSNGGAWSGAMAVGAVAELQVKWIEVVFNISSEVATASPSTSKPAFCSVDKVVGTPIASEGVMSSWDHGTLMMWLSLSLAMLLSLD
jgi:hypothetical protein